MLTARQRAGPAAVGPRRVVADTDIGSRPEQSHHDNFLHLEIFLPRALMVTCGAALETTLIDVRTSCTESL